MKCEACLEMIDGLFEGELEGRLAREASEHVAVCASCSQVYGSLRHEQELYGKYLLDVEAAPALWANLRLEIEKEKVNRASHPISRLQRWLANAFGSLHIRPLQASALVLVTIGLAVGILVRRTGSDISTNTPADTRVSGPRSSPELAIDSTPRGPDNPVRRSTANTVHGKISRALPKTGGRGTGLRLNATNREPKGRTIKNESSPPVPPVEEVALRAEQQYLAAIEILSQDVERRRALISPAAVSQLRIALAEVDQTIAATRRAMREQPRDPVAVQYMTSAYEKKVELLRETVSR